MSNILDAVSRVKWDRRTAAKRAVFLAAAAYGVKTLYPIIYRQITRGRNGRNNQGAKAEENGSILSVSSQTDVEIVGRSKSPGVNEIGRASCRERV